MSKWVQCTVYISKIVLIEVSDSDENPEAKGLQVAEDHFGTNCDEIENVQLIVDCDVERSKEWADEVVEISTEIAAT